MSIFLFGDLVSQITSYLLTKNQKKMTGTLTTQFHRHVIVYGKSNIETARMLRQLSKEFEKIVFVSSNSEIPKRILRMQSEGIQIDRVSGSPDNTEVLELAGVHNAVEFVLLHEDTPDGDRDMLMYVMNIKMLNEELPVIVEISDESSRPFFEKAGCKTIINTQSLGKNLLVRSLTDDVHLIFDELLENDEGYEIYKCSL
jgi:Trk K+ transport system NAD-binding subunit